MTDRFSRKDGDGPPPGCDVIGLDDDRGIDAAARRAAEALRGGGVIIAPTDTIYGFACMAGNRGAVERVYSIKGRPESKPSLVLVASRRMAEELASGIGAAARALMDHCWPGPLTMVLEASAGIPPELTAGTGKVGVRLPAHAFSRRLVELCGGPVLSTSANRSGDAPPPDAAALIRMFSPLVDLIVDAGPAGGVSSTVADVSSGKLVILREGAYPAPELERVLASLRTP